VSVESEDLERFREYRYRKIFNATHEQYLAEPRLNVTWLLELDAAANEVEADQVRKAAKA
jgi:hypothetical protein